MNETGTGESIILAAILFGCFWYIYRNIKRMFSTDSKQSSCGNCSSSRSCASEKASQTQEECSS